jgi:DNA polymerase-1
MSIAYELITDEQDCVELLQELAEEGATMAFDVETTGLDPATSDVRLIQLADDEGCYVIDCWQCGGWAKIAPLLAPLNLWCFYSGFEGRWLLSAGVSTDRLHDVQNLRKAVLGGGRYSLAKMAAWDLEIELPKDEQNSLWSAPELTQEQLDYAANDAIVTWQLYKYWAREANRHRGQQRECAQLLDDLLLPVIEMEETGMVLDVAHHRKLIADWQAQLRRYHDEVRQHIPAAEVANLRSNLQLSDFFAASFGESVLAVWPKTEKTGQLQITGDALAKIGNLQGFRGTPVQEALQALARFNRVDKYLGTFGESLITKARSSRDGRIHPSYNIGAAKTLRFSSSGPNIQQVPRDRLLFPDDDHLTQVRRSFIAPPGCELVSYDYSAIELRVLALLSGDDQLLHDVVYGDVHNEVASMILGDENDKTTSDGKARRSAAKGVSFGIIYGSGAGGLSLTMGTDVGAAASYIMQWQDRYPAAFGFRHDVENEARENGGFASMVDGGTIYMGKRPELPQCANYPVQRAAWTIMAEALIRHRETLLDLELYQPERARLVATIHDAMMDEAAVEDAADVAAAMAADMTQAYLDVFPDAPTDRLLEGGHGPSWAELEEIAA